MCLPQNTLETIQSTFRDPLWYYVMSMSAWPMVRCNGHKRVGSLSKRYQRLWIRLENRGIKRDAVLNIFRLSIFCLLCNKRYRTLVSHIESLQYSCSREVTRIQRLRAQWLMPWFLIVCIQRLIQAYVYILSTYYMYRYIYFNASLCRVCRLGVHVIEEKSHVPSNASTRVQL